ncbi:cation:proton antiporter [Streptomyces monticola]|uniref:Cation:proton antiporter n=1 Tax=Streptomyces monticola TaxID=2666263 RepID=A0ABW2JP11_9ACTN
MSHALALTAPAPMPLAHTLVALALILAVARVCGRIARRLRQPTVVGEIVGGVLLGPSLLGLLPGHLDTLLLPAEIRPALHVLSQLGLVFFMFGVGYHLDAAHLRSGRAKRQVAAVSLSSVALPFALGAGLAVLLHPWTDRKALAADGPLGPALFLGTAMAITAFPVLARILAERGLQRDPLGAISLACAAVQDLLAWCVLAAVVVVVQADGPWPVVRMLLQSALLFGCLIFLVRPALAWMLAPDRRWAGAGAAPVHTVIVVGVLLTAAGTEAVGLHAVFGAFAFGAIVPRDRIETVAPQVPQQMDQFSALLLPVFFTVTGMAVNIGGLGGEGLAVTAAVLAVACTGKFVGGFAAARLTGATSREAGVLGVLLNARGLTELVILNVGLSLGVIDPRLFTAMVVMAIVTTVMTGPLLTCLRRPGDDPAPPRAERPSAAAGRAEVPGP